MDKEKQLQSQIRELKGDLEGLRVRRSDINRDMSNVSSRLKYAEKELQQYYNDRKDPVVSDHAIVRYLERVKGIDVEGARDEILSEEIMGYIEKFSSGKFPGNGFTVVVKNRVIITVMGGGQNGS